LDGSGKVTGPHLHGVLLVNMIKDDGRKFRGIYCQNRLILVSASKGPQRIELVMFSSVFVKYVKYIIHPDLARDLLSEEVLPTSHLVCGSQ
jgi:hypothetical protein